MPPRSCNTRLLQDTMDTYHGVSRSLPAPTRTAITRSIRAAQAAANRGQCAEMHRNAQNARFKLERKLDALLGARRR